jgi:hypothetical protein
MKINELSKGTSKTDTTYGTSIVCNDCKWIMGGAVHSKHKYLDLARFVVVAVLVISELENLRVIKLWISQLSVKARKWGGLAAGVVHGVGGTAPKGRHSLLDLKNNDWEDF